MGGRQVPKGKDAVGFRGYLIPLQVGEEFVNLFFRDRPRVAPSQVGARGNFGDRVKML